MAFTDSEKDDIRRYCGYPVLGDTPVQDFAWRYTNEYGHMEFILNNLSTNQENIVRTVYLANLTTLESDIPSVRQNLDTKQAAVWHWNDNEIRDRMRLFNLWRRQLCNYLGIPAGPNFGGGPIAFAV